MDEEIIKKMSMYDWLVRWADVYGKHEALRDDYGSYSYVALKKCVDNLSIGLFEMGLRFNDKVILQMDNRNEFVIACLALMSIGAVPILAVPGLRKNDLDTIAQKVHPVMYIRPDEYMGFNYEEMGIKLQEANESLQYVLTLKDIHKLQSQMYDRNTKIVRPKADDTSLILLSGGTTNIPKLIPITNYAFAYHAICAGNICRLSDKTVYMAVMPVQHKLTLFSPGIMGTLFCGGTVVMCHDSSCETAFSIIEKENVNTISLVPSVAKMWLEDLEWDDSFDLSSINYIILGGARLDETDARKIMDSLNCEIIQAYGMSEGFLSLSRHDDSIYERTFYQGKPMASKDQILIIDEAGNEQPHGCIGEILVKGPYLFSGYYELDSADYFTSDGFYHTGDLGYVTDEGYIKITGRKSDQINRMGEKIMPSEIERYIAEYEKIKEVLVMGIPDDLLGERSCAFVKSDDRKMKLDEIREFLINKGVAQFKIPDQLFVLEEFPRTGAGKIDRNQLSIIANE